MKLLFCGGYCQSMLSALRSLGRKGHQIDVAVPISPGKFRIARRFASKYINQQFRVPHPLVPTADFQQRLLQLVQAGGYDVIFPFDQRIAAQIALWKEELSRHTHVISPDWPLFELVHDKAKLHGLLAANGFVVPRMYAYEGLEDLLQQDIRFPVVLKPRRTAGSLGLRYAANRSELENAYREVSAFPSPCSDVEDYRRPLVQEYIPGKIHDGLFVCRQGEIRAAMTVMRSSTYPVSGGFTVQSETTRDPELIRYCRQILEFLNYHGPCDVEVKRDERDGAYKLLEINPRIWGALELSIRAGIDFVEKSCELAVTGNTALQMDYRVGLKYWILQRELMAIRQDKGNRWRRLLRLPGLFNRDTVTGIDLTDWGPELAQLVTTLRLFTRKREFLLPPGRSFTVKECMHLAADASLEASAVRNAA